VSAGFTKGPWQCRGMPFSPNYFIERLDVGRDEPAIAQVLGPETANARLIAAAPELYEALAQARQVLATYRPDGEPTFYMEAVWNAEAALAKARGEQ
jgi:hypothetical protein